MQLVSNILKHVLFPPPEDRQDDADQEHTFRDVITLQNVLVSQTVALMAYVQSVPEFSLRVELVFALFSAMPLFGLVNMIVRQRRPADGPVYVYSRPARAFARQVFLIWLVIVLGSAWSYWQGLLPGQRG